MFNKDNRPYARRERSYGGFFVDRDSSTLKLNKTSLSPTERQTGISVLRKEAADQILLAFQKYLPIIRAFAAKYMQRLVHRFLTPSVSDLNVVLMRPVLPVSDDVLRR